MNATLSAPERPTAQGRFSPAVWFAAIAALIVAAEWTLASHLHLLPHPSVLAPAIALDLIVGLPLLFAALVIRRSALTWRAAVPVLVLSALVARALLPAEALGQGLDVVMGVGALAELTLLGVSLRKLKALRASYRAHAQEAPARLELFEQVFMETLPAPALARAAAFELSLIAYALGRREVPPTPAPDEALLTYHRESGLGGLLVGLGFAAAVELVGVHFLLAHFGYTTAAWVASALSLYGMLWIIGDWRAILARPIRLSDEALTLHIGLRWRATIPTASISARAIGATEVLPPGDRDRLDTSLMGDPNVLLTLDAPVAVRGPYGMTRTVSAISLNLDDPHALLARLGA